MKNKSAIHIQLYEPHFNYGINLVKGLMKHTRDFEDYAIFICLDTEKVKAEFETMASEILVNKNVNILAKKQMISSNYPSITR